MPSGPHMNTFLNRLKHFRELVRFREVIWLKSLKVACPCSLFKFQTVWFLGRAFWPNKKRSKISWYCSFKAVQSSKRPPPLIKAAKVASLPPTTPMAYTDYPLNWFKRIAVTWTYTFIVVKLTILGGKFFLRFQKYR